MSEPNTIMIWVVTCDFQQRGILTDVNLEEHVQPPNSKCCSVSSLTLAEYSSD